MNDTELTVVGNVVDSPRRVRLENSAVTNFRMASTARRYDAGKQEFVDAGTLWDFDDRRRGHHLGVWADDVEAEADRLEGLGMTRLWWARDADGTMTFSYHDTPYGFYLELVTSVARPVAKRLENRSGCFRTSTMRS